MRQFIAWLVAQLVSANERLKKHQEGTLAAYEAKLAEAHEAALHLHVETEKEWRPIVDQAKEFRRGLELLCSPPRDGGEVAE